MIGQERKIPIQKLHFMMGHRGRHLISPKNNIWVDRQQENLNHANIVQEEISDKPTYQKSLKVNKLRILEK